MGLESSGTKLDLNWALYSNEYCGFMINGNFLTMSENFKFARMTLLHRFVSIGSLQGSVSRLVATADTTVDGE